MQHLRTTKNEPPHLRVDSAYSTGSRNLAALLSKATKFVGILKLVVVLPRFFGASQIRAESTL